MLESTTCPSCAMCSVRARILHPHLRNCSVTLPVQMAWMPSGGTTYLIYMQLTVQESIGLGFTTYSSRSLVYVPLGAYHGYLKRNIHPSSRGLINSSSNVR